MKLFSVIAIVLLFSFHQSDGFVSFCEIKNNAQRIVIIGMLASVGICWYFLKNWNTRNSTPKTATVKETIAAVPPSSANKTLSVIDVFLNKSECGAMCTKHKHSFLFNENYDIIAQESDYQVVTNDALKSIKWDKVKYIFIDNCSYNEQGTDISRINSCEDVCAISQITNEECESLEVKLMGEIEKNTPLIGMKILENGMLCVRILRKNKGANFSFHLKLKEIPPLILQGRISAQFVTPIKQERLIMRANDSSKFQCNDNGDNIDVRLLYAILEDYASCELRGKSEVQTVKMSSKAYCDTTQLQAKSVKIYGEQGAWGKFNLGQEPISFTGKWNSGKKLFYTTKKQSFTTSIAGKPDAIVYKNSLQKLKNQHEEWV